MVTFEAPFSLLDSFSLAKETGSCIHCEPGATEEKWTNT